MLQLPIFSKHLEVTLSVGESFNEFLQKKLYYVNIGRAKPSLEAPFGAVALMFVKIAPGALSPGVDPVVTGVGPEI